MHFSTVFPILRAGIFAFAFTASLAFAQRPFELPGTLPTPSRDPGLPLPPPPLPEPRQLPFDQLNQRSAPDDLTKRGPTPNAQNVSATATFEPATVPLKSFGEYQVTIVGTHNGIEIPNPLPAPEGLVVELASKSMSVEVINGQRRESTTFHYSTTAAHPGTYVMPAFTAQVNGVPVTIPSARVQIEEPNTGDLPFQTVTAVIDLPEGEYYVGQSVAARLLVFDTADENVQAIVNVAKQSGDVLFQSQPFSRRDRVDWHGKSLNATVTPLRITPIKPGETEINVQALVYITRIGPGGRATGAMPQAMLETPPVRIRVRALPEKGRKPGFTGGIGKFEMGRPTLSATEVVVGDPVALTVPISGEGNIEAIAPPPLASDDQWQSFAPASDAARDPATGRGTKTFTYTLVPRSPSLRATPAIPFSVFDPERGQYVDLSVPPIAITVKPSASSASSGEEAKSPAVDQSPEPKQPQPILTGLAEKPGSRGYAVPLAWVAGFWTAQILPAGALLGLWAIRRRADYLAAHPEVVRRRAARLAARRHLRMARSAAHQRNTEQFVRSSIDAIRAAAAPLDTTEADSLVLAEVLANLPDDTHAQTAGRTVRRLFEHAHTERFSGHSAGANGVFDLLSDVEQTVSTIEKHQP
jgi:hypothetical protein